MLVLFLSGLTGFFLLILPFITLACPEHQSCPILKVTQPPRSGQHIADLQKLLKTAGYYKVKVDGNFGPLTAEAVKSFQKDWGLKSDGMVGDKTWEALAVLCEQPVTSKSPKKGPAGKVSIIINLNKRQLYVLNDGQVFKTYPVAIGTKSTPSPVGEFRIVHKDTNWGTGFGTRWMGLNVPWGIYGIHGTNKPGSIGTAASHGCFRMFNRHVEELFPWIPIGTDVQIVGYTPKFQGFTRVLKPKSSGQDVVMLQFRLQELGFSPDQADGRFGFLTEFGVKLFEAYHMLPVDGIADMDMLNRLDQYRQKQ